MWWIPAVLLSLPWQCDWTPPFVHRRGPELAPSSVPAPAEVEASHVAKREEATTKRETLNGHKKPVPPERVPDDVVMRVMEVGRAGFDRCFKRSVVDPAEPVKVRLHIELAGDGTIISAVADAAEEKLARCLERVGRGLPFPATKRAAVVDLPLFYRAQ